MTTLTKRYIKVNGKWIDTQAEREQWGRHYYIERNTCSDDNVYYYSDEYGVDYYVGKLEGATDDEPKDRA